MGFILTDRKGEDVARGSKYYRTQSGGITQASSPLVNAQGNYNASSTQDLINTLATLVAAAQSGEVTPVLQMSAQSREAAAEAAEEASMLVDAALSDRSIQGGAFERVGQVITDTISETMGRQGFTDKLFTRVNTPEKGIPRVFIDRHDVVAWHHTSAGAVRESLPRPAWIYPKSWWAIANILIDDEDRFYAGEEFLENKHNAGLMAIMKKEDDVSKYLLDQAANVSNDLVSFGAFTPTVFGALREQVWRWSLQTTVCMLAVDLQQEIWSNTDWHGIYSPVEKHVLFTDGKFGSIGGVEILTDGFRYDTLRVLDAGEVYMLAAPATLGAKLPIRPLHSQPIDKRPVDGSPRSGWWTGQNEAIVVGNSKGVSKGVRL